MTMRTFGKLALAGVVAMVMAAWTVTGAAQSGAPQFRTTVEIVQLQVGVAADNGEFVSGLQPEDFLLRIDGQPREVQFVFEVDLRREAPGDDAALAVDSPRARPRPQPRPVAARRHWMLFFDFSFTTRRGVLKAREAGLRFLREQVHPEDLVGVATANRYGIRLLSPFSSHHAQALEAVDTLGLVDASDLITSGFDAQESIAQALAEMAAGPAGTDGGIGATLDAMEFREYVANVANYTEQMRQFGQMLQAIEGRKHVVFFSSGFEDRAFTGMTLGQLAAGAEARATSPEAYAGDPEQMYGAAEVRSGLREMIDVFRGADAVVHAIDPSGLRDSGNSEVSRMRSAVGNPGSGGDLSSNAARTGHQALSAIASGTGGTVDWAMNDLSVALARIERSTAAFYVIAYRKLERDAATVKIQVDLARPGAEVVSAPSRLTPPPQYRDMSPAQRQLQLAELLNDEVERREISFESQVVSFPGDDNTGRQVLILQVPGLELERLAEARGDDRVELEIAALALDDDGEVLDSFRRRVTIDIERMRQRGPLQEQSFHYADSVDTPPGEHRLRLLLREAEIGWLSTRTQRYWSPEVSPQPTMARPMVLSSSGWPAPPRDDAAGFDPLVFNGRRLVPIAAPVIEPGDRFRLLVVLYHVPRHPVSGEVLAGVALELEDAQDDPYRLTELEIIGSAHDPQSDATQLLIESRLPAHVRPGTARLWVRLIDRVSGERIEEQTGIFVSSS